MDKNKQTFQVEIIGKKMMIKAENDDMSYYSSAMGLGRFIMKKMQLDPNFSTKKQL